MNQCPRKENYEEHYPENSFLGKDELTELRGIYKMLFKETPNKFWSRKYLKKQIMEKEVVQIGVSKKNKENELPKKKNPKKKNPKKKNPKKKISKKKITEEQVEKTYNTFWDKLGNLVDDMDTNKTLNDIDDDDKLIKSREEYFKVFGVKPLDGLTCRGIEIEIQKKKNDENFVCCSVPH